jgi:phage gp36-like protein
VLLQEDQATVLLHEVVARFGEKVALRLFAVATAEQGDDATQSNTNSVANSKKAHFVFIGLQYTVPPEEIWMALTRHKPLVPIGTLNAMGVNDGIGVLAVVATAPSPTST